MRAITLTAISIALVTTTPSQGREGWEMTEKLNDGSEVKLASHGEGREENYTLEWIRPGAPATLIWSASRYGHVMPSDSPLIPGIRAGVVSGGHLAVLLAVFDDGKLIRSKIGTSPLKFEEIVLPELMPASVSVTQKFALKDAFTILLDEKRDQGEFAKHIITADKDGKLLYDGGSYEEGAGIITIRQASDGSTIVHDPRGKVYPKGDSVLRPPPPNWKAPVPPQSAHDVMNGDATPSIRQDAQTPAASSPSESKQAITRNVPSSASSSSRMIALIAVLAAAVGLVWLALRKGSGGNS